MNIIVMDQHQLNDGRIQRFISYIISRDINVYHMHYNLSFDSLDPGFFDYIGANNFRINLLKRRKGKIFGFLRLIKIFGHEIIDATENALREMKIDTVQPTIIHVHDPMLLPIAVNLIRYKFKNFKIVYDRHELYEKYPGYKNINIYTSMELITKRYLSGIVVVTKDMIKYIDETFNNSNLIIVPNYPCLKDFDNNLIIEKINTFEESSNIFLVYVGVLNRKFDRDIDLLLKLAKSIMTNDERINFTVAGSWADGELENLLQDYQIMFPDRFQFLGEVSQEKNSHLIQNAHLGFFFIKPNSTYWVKVSPNKVFEYIASGVVPVVRADLDVADDLRDFSLIFDQNTSDDDLIKAVSELLSDTKKHKEFMKRAFEARKKYSWDAVAVEYINLYNKIF